MPMRRFIISISLVISVSSVWAWLAYGTQIPQGFPPPTYEPPLASTSDGGALDGYELRSFRTHELTFGVNVPSAELQQLLPAGYLPMAPLVNIRIAYQQRSEVSTTVHGVSPGSYGPSSLLDVFATVQSPIATREVVVLLGERSTQASVDLANLLFGEGSTRLADLLSVEMEERGGWLRYTVRVIDKTVGLDMRAEANLPAGIVARGKNDPVPIPVRFLNGTNANPPFRLADQFDFISVVPTAGNFTLHVPGHRLRLPAGDLTISGIGPTLVLSRWRELFTKREPSQ